MTNQQSLNKTASDIIICDTNVVILMTLFKPTVMFAAVYSFGKIKVHQCVIDQLQNWVDKNNQKAKRFSIQILEQAIDLCKSVSKNIKEPTPDQFTRSAAYISKKERSLGSQQKSMATDKTDQLLLILAYVNKAHLATQEKTMTSVGELTLPPGSILRFEDLVLDLIKLNLLVSDDLKSGLYSLDSFKEKLDANKRKQIESHIK